MVVLALMIWVGAASATAQSVTLTQVVDQADPALRWVVPAAIPYGAALGPNQLSATAAVAGTFLYSPLAGELPPPGVQPLSVAFTPANPGYRNASLTVDLTVTSPGSSSFQITLANPLVSSFTVSTDRDTSILLIVSPVGDFHQPVSLACPQSIVVTCAFTPAVVRPTAGAVQVTLTLRAIQLALNRSPSASGSFRARIDSDRPQENAGSYGRPPMFACVAWLAWLGLRRRLPSGFRRMVLLAFIAVLLPVCAASLGCGSGIRPLTLTVTGTSLVESRSLFLAIRIPPQ